jgi:hypothetical protein
MDKLADNKDIENFEKIQKDIIKKSFDDIPEAEALHRPLIFCHFAKYNFFRFFAIIQEFAKMFYLQKFNKVHNFIPKFF